MTVPRSRSEKLDYFRKCLDVLRDWSAHQKFLKKSRLVYSGEILRTDFPTGFEHGLRGWELWRRQFAPKSGEDLSPVESELKRLFDQRSLKPNEYERLRRLYGLATQVRIETSRQAVMEMCRCGERLTWTPEYSRYYCNKCQKYPQTCPECRHDLFWVPEYGRYYCNECNSYKEPKS